MTAKIANTSFIVVTLNEEFAIKKCLNSLFKLETKNCEFICIDSSSSDNTLKIIKSHAQRIDDFKIFQISGEVNSAIARNIGIMNATKEYLFFIDGDVEITKDFTLRASRLIKDYDAICGNIEDVEYDAEYKNIINKSFRYKIKDKTIVSRSGGIFLTKKTIVVKIGLFDERFKRSQDYDFSLRLSRLSPILYLSAIMGRHHTIPYHNSKRLFDHIKNGHSLYTGLLIRKNIKNPNILILIKDHAELFFGIPFYLLLILCMVVLNSKLFLISISIFLFDIAYGKYKKKNLFERFYMHYVSPIFVITGFFKSFKKFKYSVEKIEL